MSEIASSMRAQTGRPNKHIEKLLARISSFPREVSAHSVLRWHFIIIIYLFFHDQNNEEFDFSGELAKCRADYRAAGLEAQWPLKRAPARDLESTEW